MRWQTDWYSGQCFSDILERRLLYVVFRRSEEDPDDVEMLQAWANHSSYQIEADSQIDQSLGIMTKKNGINI